MGAVSNDNVDINKKGGEIRPQEEPPVKGAAVPKFDNGNEVEVTFNKDGANNSLWFPATIIKNLSNDSYLVKYWRRKSDDDEAVVEKATVDLQHIRPSPPPQKSRKFVLLEKVDAYFDFSWTCGVVTRECDNEYVVYFKSTNKKMSFTGLELRTHVEWVNGKWIASSKDVRIPTEHPKDVPCNASKIASCEAPLTALVARKNKTEARETTPSMNTKKILNQNPNDDALLSSPLKKLKKQNAPQTPKSALSETDTMKTETPIKQNSSVGKKTPASIDRQTDAAAIEAPRKENSSLKIESRSPGSKVAKLKKISEVGSDAIESVKRRGRPPKSVPKSPQSLTRGTAEGTNGKVCRTETLPCIIGLASTGTKRHGDNNSPQSPTDHSQISSSQGKDHRNDPARHTLEESTQFKCPENTLRKRRGRRPKVVEPNKKLKVLFSKKDELVASNIQLEKPSSEKGKITSVNPFTESPDSIVDDSPDTSLGKEDKPVVSRDHIENSSSQNAVKISVNPPAGSPDSTLDDSPVASMRDEGLILENYKRVSPKKLVQQDSVQEDENRLEIEVHAAPIDSIAGAGFDLVQLPFVKTIPLWDMLASMEALQMVPQSPHFLPLESKPKKFREGLAIGYMVTFVRIVKEIAEWRADEPRSSIEECLESLAELEDNGFDVKMVGDRLNNLLIKKDKQELLRNDLKEHGSRIMEHKNERKKIDEEMEEIEKEMKELRERLEAATAKREIKDAEIAVNETFMNCISERMQSIQYDFEQAAAAPW